MAFPYLRTHDLVLVSVRGTVQDSHSSHEQAKQRSDRQKLFESLAVDCRDLQQAKNNHVYYHGPFSSKLVSRQSENRRTDRSEKKREGDGLGDPRLADIVVFRELHSLDTEGMEIECLRDVSNDLSSQGIIKQSSMGFHRRESVGYLRLPSRLRNRRGKRPNP